MTPTTRLRVFKNTESVPTPDDFKITAHILKQHKQGYAESISPFSSDNESENGITPIPLEPIQDAQEEFTINDVVLSDTEPAKRVGNPTAIPEFRKDAKHFTEEDMRRFGQMRANWAERSHTQGRRQYIQRRAYTPRRRYNMRPSYGRRRTYGKHYNSYRRPYRRTYRRTYRRY